MQVSVIRSYEDFLALGDSWTTLYEQQSFKNPFLAFAWLDLWLQHFAVHEDWLILIVKDGGELIGAAPFYYVGRDLHFIGDPMLSDYMDFLTVPDRDSDILAAIMAKLKSMRWSRLYLKRLHDGKERAELIRMIAEKAGFSAAKRINCQSPYILFESEWDAYYSGLSKKLRKDLRLTMNKLEQEGHIKFETACVSSSEKVFECLKEFHKNRQTQKVGTSLFENETIFAFLKEIAQQEWADLSTISLDGKVISAVLGLKGEDRFFYWIPSFNDRYFQYSLGKHHLKELVQRTCDNGLKRFDFMIGDESYKMRWATGAIDNYEVVIYRHVLAGATGRAKNALRDSLKNMKNNSEFLSRLWVWLSKVRR